MHPAGQSLRFRLSGGSYCAHNDLLIAQRQQVELQVQVATDSLPTGTNLNYVAAICLGRQDHMRWGGR
jgi:hypothetical protein